MRRVSPWSPVRLNSGVILRNRFVLAPMTTDSSHPDGTVSDAELRYIERRARTGFAAGITSCAHVEEDGRAWQGIGAAGPHHLESLRAVAAAFHGGTGLALLQLYDGGRIANPHLIGGSALRAPSPIASLRPGALVPREMRPEEVARTVDAFGRAAAMARAAGFDGIEIHGANHYLIHQFLSPRANQRRDGWGGSRPNRMRFALAVTTAVRRAVGNGMIVGFRVNPFESEVGGFELEDSLDLSRLLSEEQIDYVHISMDNFRKNAPQPENRDWTTAPGGAETRNPITAFAEAVDGRCAVVASGGITTLTDVEEVLGSGADLVAVARAVLIDPEWLSKVRHDAHAVRTHMPPTKDRIVSELTIPSRMADYLLSRPGWIPTETDPSTTAS